MFRYLGIDSHKRTCVCMVTVITEKRGYKFERATEGMYTRRTRGRGRKQEIDKCIMSYMIFK